MYLEAIILGVLIGLARNGRLSNFFEVKFKGWALSILALILFVVPYGLRLADIPFEKIQIFPYIAMGICALITVLNFEKFGMKLIFLGLVLNMVIMGFNNYQMPVDALKMTQLGFDSFVESLKINEVVNYTTLDGSHALSQYLGKVIALPKVYPFAKLLSLGDIIITIGVVFLIQYEMLLSSLKTKGSMVQFTYNSRLRR